MDRFWFNTFIKLGLRILSHRFFYILDLPEALPFNLAINITNRCNARCKFCRIYDYPVDELTLQEYEKIFKSIGKYPLVVTLSGGEPFLRDDIVELSKIIIGELSPAFLIIPTNGILNSLIPTAVHEIAKFRKNLTKIQINLSFDGIGAEHDEYRGYKGCYEKAMDTLVGLKGLKDPDIAIKVHILISRYNVSKVEPLIFKLNELFQDSCEIDFAENRAELNNMNCDMAASTNDILKLIDSFEKYNKRNSFKGGNKFIWAARKEYYKLVRGIFLEKKQMIPCYAGWSSAHISADGCVWTCGTKSGNMGFLPDFDYDFHELWISRGAAAERMKIKNEKCFCSSVNVSYINMLFNLRSIQRILMRSFLTRR